MNFGKIILDQGIRIILNYAIWIQTGLLFILKPNIFMKTLLVMLKNGLTPQTTVKMIKGSFQQIKTRKRIGFFKDELGGKITIEFVELRAETYAHLMEDDSEKKEATYTNKCVIKKKYSSLMIMIKTKIANI